MTNDASYPEDFVPTSNTLKCAKRRYECDECEHSSNDKKALRRHKIRKHIGNLPHKCEVIGCDYSAITPSELMEHKKVHINEQEYLCDMCDYRCNLKTGLQSHKRKKHLLTDEALLEKSKAYKCKHCDYTCGNTSRLKNHLLTHVKADEKPFKCMKCSYTACRKQELENHMTSKHAEVKKPIFRCEKCDFTAVTKATINKHIARCTGDHPYTCTKCEYKTAVLKNLYSHAETHVDQ